jgi:hypothetical protein
MLRDRAEGVVERAGPRALRCGRFASGLTLARSRIERLAGGGLVAMQGLDEFRQERHLPREGDRAALDLARLGDPPQLEEHARVRVDERGDVVPAVRARYADGMERDGQLFLGSALRGCQVPCQLVHLLHERGVGAPTGTLPFDRRDQGIQGRDLALSHGRADAGNHGANAVLSAFRGDGSREVVRSGAYRLEGACEGSQRRGRLLIEHRPGPQDRAGSALRVVSDHDRERQRPLPPIAVGQRIEPLAHPLFPGIRSDHQIPDPRLGQVVARLLGRLVCDRDELRARSRGDRQTVEMGQRGSARRAPGRPEDHDADPPSVREALGRSPRQPRLGGQCRGMIAQVEDRRRGGIGRARRRHVQHENRRNREHQPQSGENPPIGAAVSPSGEHPNRARQHGSLPPSDVIVTQRPGSAASGSAPPIGAEYTPGCAPPHTPSTRGETEACYSRRAACPPVPAPGATYSEEKRYKTVPHPPPWHGY